MPEHWAATGQPNELSQKTKIQRPSSLNSLASGPPSSYLEKGTGAEFRQGSPRSRGKVRSETGMEAKT